MLVCLFAQLHLGYVPCPGSGPRNRRPSSIMSASLISMPLALSADMMTCRTETNRRQASRYITEHRYRWVVWKRRRSGCSARPTSAKNEVAEPHPPLRPSL